MSKKSPELLSCYDELLFVKQNRYASSNFFSIGTGAGLDYEN